MMCKVELCPDRDLCLRSSKKEGLLSPPSPDEVRAIDCGSGRLPRLSALLLDSATGSSLFSGSSVPLLDPSVESFFFSRRAWDFVLDFADGNQIVFSSSSS